ncbi:MAG TPA: DUF4136 domain-containing protein [Polyangiaceae bacterium]|nr:DUF4136 domain-containing protein [Polyangiaceae bacterium]
MKPRRILGCAGALVFIGCAPAPDIAERTTREIIATTYDPKIDFGSFATFAVASPVSVVSDTTDAGTLSADDSALITDRISANMRDRGYLQVETSSRPELGLSATVLSRVDTATVVSPGYWWGLPGYGATPSYWGYPGGSYYPGFGYSSVAFKSATLIIQMADLRDAGASPPSPLADAAFSSDRGTLGIEVAWVAFAHGYASLQADLAPAAPLAVDQAFAQSPYIRKR